MVGEKRNYAGWGGGIKSQSKACFAYRLLVFCVSLFEVLLIMQHDLMIYCRLGNRPVIAPPCKGESCPAGNPHPHLPVRAMQIIEAAENQGE